VQELATKVSQQAEPTANDLSTGEADSPALARFQALALHRAEIALRNVKT